MQKIIMSILLLMASIPVTAYAITVNINGISYDCESAFCPDANTIQVAHNDGVFQCSSASNFGVVGATFQIRTAGDIRDMVMSDVLCFNESSEQATLSISLSQTFTADNIQTRWYFMSLQGSFFSFGGGAQPTDFVAAAASVFSGECPRVDIGTTSFSNVNFADSFGPQNPLQIVNTFTPCDVTEVDVPALSVNVAPGDGIYLFGSNHTGSAGSAATAGAYLGSLTVTIDVHNPVNVNSNGQIQVDLLGANSVIPVQNGQPITVKFDVRSVDISSLRFGPLGGTLVAPTDTGHFKDWNKDKIEDVRVKFGNPPWDCDDTVAVLTGKFKGTNPASFTATQNITPQPCH